MILSTRFYLSVNIFLWEDLKSNEDDKSFVKSLKKIPKDNVFYDIHEFMLYDFY